jgi:hypothetical protein
MIAHLSSSIIGGKLGAAGAAAGSGDDGSSAAAAASEEPAAAIKIQQLAVIHNVVSGGVEVEGTSIGDALMPIETQSVVSGDSDIAAADHAVSAPAGAAADHVVSAPVAAADHAVSPPAAEADDAVFATADSHPDRLRSLIRDTNKFKLDTALQLNLYIYTRGSLTGTSVGDSLWTHVAAGRNLLRSLVQVRQVDVPRVDLAKQVRNAILAMTPPDDFLKVEELIKGLIEHCRKDHSAELLRILETNVMPALQKVIGSATRSIAGSRLRL